MVLAIIVVILGSLLLMQSLNTNGAIEGVALANGFNGTVTGRALVLKSVAVGILKGPGLVPAESKDVTAVKLDGFEENQNSDITESNSILSALGKVLVMDATELGLSPNSGVIESLDTVFEATNKFSACANLLLSPFSVYTSVTTQSQTPVNVWGSVSGSTTFPANSLPSGYGMVIQVFGTIQNVAATAESAVFTLQMDGVTVISITSAPTTTTPSTLELSVTFTLLFDGSHMSTDAICKIINRITFTPGTAYPTRESNNFTQISFDSNAAHTFQLVGHTTNSSLTLIVGSSVCTSIAGGH